MDGERGVRREMVPVREVVRMWWEAFVAGVVRGGAWCERQSEERAGEERGEAMSS